MPQGQGTVPDERQFRVPGLLKVAGGGVDDSAVLDAHVGINSEG